MNGIDEYVQILKTCLMEKPLCMKGRARRKEYWTYAIAFSIISGGLGKAVNSLSFLGETLSSILGWIVVLVVLALWIPMITVSVRRLHDIGKPGIYFLMGLIPIVGMFIMLIYFLKDSDKDANAYGECPK